MWRLSVYVLLALSTIGVYQVLWFEDKWFWGVDNATHYQWVTQFHKSLSEGNLDPRWAPDFWLGLGDPSFVYGHKLYLYLTSAMVEFTGDVWIAMKVVVLLSTFLLGVAVFEGSRPYLKAWLATCSAAMVQWTAFFVFLPYYHASLPWHTSLPLLALFFFRSLVASDKKIDIWTSLILGLLSFAHFFVAFMAFISVAAGLLISGIESAAKCTSSKLFWWGISCMIGFAIAGMAIIPSITLAHWIHSHEWMVPGIWDWKNKFIFPLVTSRIYGISWNAVQWIMPSVYAFGLGTAIICLRLSKAPLSPTRSFQVFAVATGCTSLLLGSELAYPLYAFFKPFASLQFGYRWITLAAFTSVIVVIATLEDREAIRHRLAMGTITIAILLHVILSAVIQVKIQREAAPSGMGKHLLDSMAGQRQVLPITAGLHWKSYVHQGGLSAHCANVQATCNVLENKSQMRSWRITVPNPTSVVLPLFWYPAWQATIDGIPQTPAADPTTGLVTVQLEPGNHEVRVQWKYLKEERIGQFVSAAALSLLLFTCCLRLRSAHQVHLDKK